MPGLAPDPSPSSLLVLAVGNELSGDDGLGVHAIRALQHPEVLATLPPDVELVDGGTAGLALLPAISGARALVVIDAVDVGAEPGTLHVLTGSDLYATLVRLSVHQIGTSDLLAAARLAGVLPEHVVLVGVQPATVAAGVDLSPVVAAALPAVVDTVRDWCHRYVREGV